MEEVGVGAAVVAKVEVAELEVGAAVEVMEVGGWW